MPIAVIAVVPGRCLRPWPRATAPWPCILSLQVDFTGLHCGLAPPAPEVAIGSSIRRSKTNEEKKRRSSPTRPVEGTFRPDAILIVPDASDATHRQKYSNKREDRFQIQATTNCYTTMMAWVPNGKSGSGSQHRGKDLTTWSKVPLAPAGLSVDHIDPVIMTRHVRAMSAYEVYKLNQLVKDLDLPSSVASSPASLEKLTGKKVVMHMHFNSTTMKSEPGHTVSSTSRRPERMVTD